MNRFTYRGLTVAMWIFYIIGLALFATISSYYFFVVTKIVDNIQSIRIMSIAGSMVGGSVFIMGGIALGALRRRRKDNRLAYIDRTYNVFNESYFLIIVGRKRGKGHGTGWFATLDIDRANEAATTVNTATLEVTRELTKVASESLKTRYNAKLNQNSGLVTYAYRASGSFLLYIDEIDQRKAVAEFEQLNKEISRNIVKENIASTLGYKICMIEDDGKSEIEDLVAKCEVARNSGYASMEGNIVIFEPTMIQKTMDEMTLAHDIVNAIKNREFEVYYQPKFDIKNDRFVGAEALVRWRHPTKGLVSPATFIPFAERNDQIIDIDRYCFDRVCQDIAYWKKRGTRLLNISVNLSRNGIYRTDLLDFLNNTMEKYQVSPLLVELELTESSGQRDMLYMLSIIKQLKAMKIKLSVDDFGTGYSSLSNLRKLPMDTLKIDKSFFDAIEVDKKARDIVKTTIDMAKALEMKVVAEGIQTAKQVAFLKGTECDMIQGYFYSKPLSREEFEIFLKNNEFEHTGKK